VADRPGPNELVARIAIADPDDLATGEDAVWTTSSRARPVAHIDPAADDRIDPDTNTVVARIRLGVRTSGGLWDVAA